ncbi:hypothetical protein FNV43_RR21492 [Rhamnella rubrinervis]|uniref:Uncharacterized protein n=1 Tax=Rhamnella rubrinervis TaxID=2594499 RepID=A0A8K0E0U2_9ROSA|nr:hypothetical protein FNV43_RR21492 [Rhamnella rubrinervis]
MTTHVPSMGLVVSLLSHVIPSNLELLMRSRALSIRGSTRRFFYELDMMQYGYRLYYGVEEPTNDKIYEEDKEDPKEDPSEEDSQAGDD